MLSEDGNFDFIEHSMGCHEAHDVILKYFQHLKRRLFPSGAVKFFL